MKKIFFLFLVLIPLSLFSQKDKYYESIMLFSNVLNHIKVNYLEEKDAAKIRELIDKIHQICESEEIPNVLNKAFCEQCSYYELCYVD